MRITITCEECGRRHQLERQVETAGPIWIVCHDCETPLRAEFEHTQIHAAAAPATPDRAMAGGWGGILDVSQTGSATGTDLI